MNADEKLAQIAALCEQAEADAVTGFPWLYVYDVRAVLDAPSVPAARAGGIDRDALRHLIGTHLWTGSLDRDVDRLADGILALVQPAPPGGVRLTPEERAAIIRSRDLLARPHHTGWLADTLRALAARLEEAAS